MTTPARETTQFSMVEFNAWKLDMDAPLTAKVKAMDLFRGLLGASEETTARQVAAIGGLDNLQRVRVFVEPGGPTSFELVPKLPISILEQKKEQTNRELRKQQALAKLESLKNPKEREEFIRRVLVAIVGKAALDLLKAQVRVASAAVARDLKAQRKPPRKPPVGTLARSDFERALQQDKKNRIEAAKKAADEFRKTHPDKKEKAA